MNQPECFIAIDWGTSHLRAFLCQVNNDKTLTVIDRANSLGVNKITSSFEETLFNCIAPWLTQCGDLKILMSGPIGSSIGWKETSYLSCPTYPKNITDACISFTCREHQISIVPGVSCQLANNNYDVMRGEELQILGWLQLDKQHYIGTHLICLPGTHTKWVLVNNGKIELFKTAMTGELFDLLNNHSVLIQESIPSFDLTSFEKGADFTLKSELGSFTHGLFSVRSKQLFGELSKSQASSYLSGLLIGSDVRAALNAEEWQLSQLNNVSIIGAKHLSEQFSLVLSLHGIKSDICKVVDTTILGFNAVYQQLTTQDSSEQHE